MSIFLHNKRLQYTASVAEPNPTLDAMIWIVASEIIPDTHSRINGQRATAGLMIGLAAMMFGYDAGILRSAVHRSAACP